MAKKLSKQGRSAYQCPPKACPAPVDLLPYPEIMSKVRQDWAARMASCRSGKAKKETG